MAPDAPRPAELLEVPPPSPGRFIREQRQRQGVSIDQLAAATKIPRRSLEALEEDRFEALPGPVFVKGFLRCASRSLGLDPAGALEIFYERERALSAAKRRPLTAPHPALPAASPAPLPPEAELPAPITPTPTVGAPAAAAQAAAPAAPSLHGARRWIRLLMELGPTNLLLWGVVVVFVLVLVLTAITLDPGATAPTSG